MKLYLAEKPDQAFQIAKVIGIEGRDNGFIRLKDGGVFTWMVGHLLEQLMPDEYDEKWKPWNWDTLPIVPEKWKLKPAKGKSKQLKIVKSLLKKASAVVICTDAGREGELIAREVMDFAGYKGKVERLWLSTLVEDDIRQSLKDLLPGEAKLPLYQAALARSHADWLYGMNLSRAAAMASGDQMSVGRVQTPTLAMVVRRDLEIDNFVSKTYYELEATVDTEKGHTVTLTHAPKEEDRIFDKKYAQKLLEQATGAEGPLSVKQSKGKESPPMPFSIGTLQRDASRRFGFTAEKTLQVAQSLYEKKAISYPRTDCAYLPSSMKHDIDKILGTVKEILPKHVDVLVSMGPVLRNKVFNDKKLTDHHGIVPTQDRSALDGLSKDEGGMYRMIAIRFMQSIGPDKLFDATRITMDANGVPFSANGRVITNKGWSAIEND